MNEPLLEKDLFSEYGVVESHLMLSGGANAISKRFQKHCSDNMDYGSSFIEEAVNFRVRCDREPLDATGRVAATSVLLSHANIRFVALSDFVLLRRSLFVFSALRRRVRCLDCV